MKEHWAKFVCFWLGHIPKHRRASDSALLTKIIYCDRCGTVLPSYKNRMGVW